jgi:hypothetical protein
MYAKLDFGLGKDRIDSVGEAREPVNCRNEDVLNAAVFKLAHNARPELGTLVLLDPEPQKLFSTVQMYCQSQI